MKIKLIWMAGKHDHATIHIFRKYEYDENVCTMRPITYNRPNSYSPAAWDQGITRYIKRWEVSSWEDI